MAEKLGIGAMGGEVGRLHGELRRHGFEVPAAEVRRQFFGPGTREAVLRCQQEHGLACSGDVDESTTAVLSGSQPAGDVRRSSAGMTAAGTFLRPQDVRSEARPPQADAMAAIAAARPPAGAIGNRPPAERPPAERPPAGSGGRAPAPSLEQSVKGQILLEHGLPASKVKLRLYQRGFGGAETLLKEMETDEMGRYDTAYRVDQGTANIEIRAVSGQQEIPLSKTRFGAGEHERLNLVAPATLQPLAPEYTRLAADVSAQIGSMAQLAGARENADRRDLTVLNRATGWDARLTALAANASTLSADPTVGLSQEVLYALFRAGLPTDKLLLARVSDAAVGHALSRTRDARIVNLSDGQIKEAKQRFEVFAREARLTMPAPGSRSTYGDLLTAAGLKEGARAKFASVYVKHRGDAAELWKNALDAGVDTEDVRKLQLQGKLAFLTGNSEGVTTRLQQGLRISDPVQLVDRGLFEAESWKQEIKALTAEGGPALDALVPPVYGGDKAEDRLNAYAEDMARKVRLSYPTQVVGRMIEQDQADAFTLGPARGATAKLLKNAAGQGFRLGQTPVASFLKVRNGVQSGMSAQEFDMAQREMKTLQRVYQISPTNDSMPILMQLGLTSAYDVVAVSEPVFLELYGMKFPSLEEARLVYRKAQQISSVTYNLFTIAKKLDSDLQIFGMSAPAEVRDSVKNELIKQFPTMESLFGSMDFCECQHCRSVLSPAAYLVDLLQFIDAEPQVWSNFLNRWTDAHEQVAYTANYMKPYAAFIQRRPDVPRILLTCENTHTALPYIDLVNEILEYYVANDTLNADAVRDTGSATTQELLAEPQNVIREAYDHVREARYPLALPFDLWLDTVRAFCDYFETPFWRVLEVLRPSDELFVSAQVHDRAAIFIESLGLSPVERALFTDPNPIPTWHELYGFNTATEATTVARDAGTKQRVDLNSAKALSRRLGVTYKELVEIIQTGFLNPELAQLGVLYKLSVSIHRVRFSRDTQNRAFYNQNKDLLDKDRGDMSAADQQRFDLLSQADWLGLKEVQAFDARIQEFADEFHLTLAQVDADLHAIPFDQILVLADPDAGCDFDLTSVRYASGRAADDIAFLKINLFVRLWRKLGWTIEETDRALQAFVPANAPFQKPTLNKQPLMAALIYVAHLKTLDERLRVGKQSRLKLVTLWSDIATTGKKSLYAQLFLTRTVLKTDDVFDHPLGQYLSAVGVTAMAQSRWHEVQQGNVAPADKIEPAAFTAVPTVRVSYDALQEVQRFAYQGVLNDVDKAALLLRSPSPVLPGLLDAVQAKGRAFSLVKGHLLALQGALGLAADDVRRILEDAGKSLDTAALSLPHLSVLYRYGLLAKALKLPVRDLIALKELSGLHPFMPVQSDPPATLDQDQPFTQTVRFVEMAEQVKDAGLKVEDLEYLLRHRFDETGKYRQNPVGTRALLTTLAEGIRAIGAENAVPDDPGAMTDDTLRSKLGLLLPPDVVERFLAMMNGTAEFTATRNGVPPANQLRPEGFTDEPAIREVRYNSTRQEQKLTYRGVLFDPDKVAFLGRLPKPLPSNPHVPSAILGALLDDVQRQARAFFDKHLQKQAPLVQPVGGFLDAADFDLLFASPPAGLTASQLQERVRQQRARLAEAFLPFLQERLIRQFIVQTMTAQTGADPALVEGLLTDARLLGEAQATGDPVPLLASLTAVSEPGLTATFFASTDGTGAALDSSVFASADTGLKDKRGNRMRPAGANSARYDGYLEVPTPGAYRFYIVLDKQNASADLRFAHLPQPLFWSGTAATDNAVLGGQPTEYLELKPGFTYRLTVDLRNLGGGEARLLVQGETLPKDTLAQLVLYPLTAVTRAERAIQLLTKSLQLVNGLGLTERELRYLLTHPTAFGAIDLRTLPTRADDDSLGGARSLFAQFLRLAAYTRLKRDLASGTDDLIDIFEANATGDLGSVYALISRLTRRDAATVKATAKALATSPSFASEKPVQRLWEGLQVVERFGVPVESLVEWTHIVSSSATPEQRFGVARDLKEAIKARFEPETWQRVAQPIFDKLRQRQRDALVAYVMHQHGFARPEQLYEYFLIDPGMEPVVQTSRIRLAISSVQLFVQRCLLNLEKHVHPSAIINTRHWEWMKRYRVWEANRKIFLFPENWLEPEFRDDKTHLFSELEGALLQGDVSNDLVEDAFLKYLRKLEELARLDIVAMHLEDKADPSENTLHVIGRTYSESHKYFYRRYSHEMWTPWEPVTAEIEGDHLAPVVWRDRLYLFWVTFMDKGDPNAGPPAATKKATDMKLVYMDKGAPPAAAEKATDMTLPELVGAVKAAVATKTVELQLHWSEYLHGEWSTRESGSLIASLARIVPFNFDNKAVFIHVSKEAYEHGEERGVYINLGGPISQAFYLAGRNSASEKVAYGSTTANPYGYQPLNLYNANVGRANRYSGSGALTVEFKRRIATQVNTDPIDTVETPSILALGGSYTLLPCDNDIRLGPPDPTSLDTDNRDAVAQAIQSGLAEIATLMKPIFYQDKVHTFFIEPSVVERTIEEWEEWITRTPLPDPGWENPDWWRDIPIEPEIPWRVPLPEPGDPWILPFDPESLITVKPARDWLVNPATGLVFDEELIGPAGRIGLALGPSTEVAGAIVESGMPVNVHAESGLGSGSAAVLAGAAALERTGLTQIAGGLNIVGGAGLNSALAGNLAASSREGFGATRRDAGRMDR